MFKPSSKRKAKSTNSKVFVLARPKIQGLVKALTLEFDGYSNQMLVQTKAF
jgi:hypothetical protein